jgi:hypothetical protein
MMILPFIRPIARSMAAVLQDVLERPAYVHREA